MTNAYGCSGHAQYHARHFGLRRGVTLHDMISDQYPHPYIQIISPHMREAHSALDAILHHETELPIQEMMSGSLNRVFVV